MVEGTCLPDTSQQHLQELAVTAEKERQLSEVAPHEKVVCASHIRSSNENLNVIQSMAQDAVDTGQVWWTQLFWGPGL